MSMCPCVAFADQLCAGSVSDLCKVSGAEGRSNQVYSVWDAKSTPSMVLWSRHVPSVSVSVWP